MEPYQIAVILPHCQLFGGVRRFLELGEIFIRNGHRMIVFTPEGKAPEWFQFSGKVEKLEKINDYSLTLLFLTETDFLPELLKANSLIKVLYHVGPRVRLGEVLKHKEIFIFSNSTNMYLLDKRKYGIETIKAIGGVNIPEKPKPIIEGQDPFVIMCYGRLARKGKGTHIVVRAAKRLFKKGYPVKLLLFDAPLDETGLKKAKQFNPGIPFEFVLNHPVNDNETLFKKATVFVAVEKKGGWSNTAAEALACGIPLVGSNTGTNDFLIDNVTGLKVLRHSFFVEKALKKLMGNVALQRELAQNGREKIITLGWEPLAKFILGFIHDQIRKP